MSDHCPLLLNTDIGSNYMGCSNFKFEAWWTIEESLEREIKTTWESFTGTIVEELEQLQLSLRRWALRIKKR